MIMMTKKSKGFIREHADKEVLDRVQIELYIFMLKLLKEEMDESSPTNQTSS